MIYRQTKNKGGQGKKAQDKAKTVGVSFSPVILAHLDSTATQLGISRSELIERLIVASPVFITGDILLSGVNTNE